VLSRAGVATIEGTYCRSGDEGRFTGVDVFDSESRPLSFDVPKDIASTIENLVNALAFPGYQDGGGSIRLDVALRSITRESYSIRFERSYGEPEVY
jgi:hypothetical protein